MSITHYRYCLILTLAMTIAGCSHNRTALANDSAGANVDSAVSCPVMGDVAPPSARHTAAGAMSNADWWP
ncbi:MAG: hypothetical protein ACYTGQ_14455, partial [Planctomycetota bacterium]